MELIVEVAKIHTDANDLIKGKDEIGFRKL
jgi:hypothetical protein